MDITVAIITGVFAVIAAVMSARASRHTKAVGNGFTTDVLKTLGRMEGLIEAHVKDERAHKPVGDEDPVDV